MLAVLPLTVLWVRVSAPQELWRPPPVLRAVLPWTVL